MNSSSTLQKYSFPPLEKDLAPKIQTKIDQKTKPLGALGELEKIALQIALIQNSLSPELKNPVLYLFAADHGITDEKVSAYPKEVTWQMVQNFLTGGACSNVFSNFHGFSMKVVDAGVDHEWEMQNPNLIVKKIANGTANFNKTNAMTMEQALLCLETGYEIIRTQTTDSQNVIAFGEMGIGNTSSASLIHHCISGIPLDELVGKGTGLDREGRERKQEVLKSSLKRGGTPTDPLEILSQYGGFEIAMMAGAFLAVGKTGKTILVDGFIATAAFAIANLIEPNLKDFCIFSHESEEVGHKKILAHYQVTPILRLGMRLGEGTGALAAYSILQLSVKFLNEMASFGEAKVSEKET
ncbi:nicotinate-nucleotide--dimethylbenzimidazole phosphoribosyltransferase [Leptospira kobayashii]|uniref:Nicotinate-nucleotide--dimethylbenzimidazole phosphoribosyltransferase n=1 Tax=Leptospira kobayashii TaxID=1917830 RepID=A0ABM7UGN5_9LEPT|nr:nicotinate-nucleotide--dimethylbenzimidazole phosphoribosyltransferase [Leptospira kobayashii]BDA77594.1 nicotinate-nucleotide--dimethylbenzimidazole phosphoribosyltransferase [Leptospira kobayashii]